MILVDERFEGDWEARWGGNPRYGYPTNQGSDADAEVRLLIRGGQHYGTDYRRSLGRRTRKGRLAYALYLSGDWNPTNKTGKLPGVLDSQFEPRGYGNNKPSPHGGSIRTWFGPNRTVGLYVYHAGQANAWGDSLSVGAVPLWTWVNVTIEWDLDAGYVRMKLGDNEWRTMHVTYSLDTAFDTAWLCAYFGGADLAPSNMAADVDDFVVEELSSPPPPPPSADEKTLIAAELRALAERVEAL